MAHRAVVSVTQDRANGNLMRRAAMASLGVSVLLVAAKFAAFLATNSVAMLASLADSGLDLFTSSINLVAIRSALTPPDAEHRFGHGKAEPLAGLAQGAFIAGSAVFVAIEAINRFFEPHPLERAGIGLAVMALSIVAAGGLVLYQRMVVARTHSPAIGADRTHYIGDLATNLGVVLSIILVTRFNLPLADPIIGLVIAVFLGWNAWHVFRDSSNQLMDHELPDDARAKIKNIVMRHAEVRNLHDLRTRAAGTDTFIQLHIEMDADLSLIRAHEVSDAVEADICAAFPHAEVMIHQDPAGVEMPPALAKV
jgi:ferrous-iron efflux pump FieF